MGIWSHEEDSGLWKVEDVRKNKNGKFNFLQENESGKTAVDVAQQLNNIVLLR